MFLLTRIRHCNTLSDIECFSQSSKSVYDSNIITRAIFTFGQILCLRGTTNQNKICEKFATSILSHFKMCSFCQECLEIRHFYKKLVITTICNKTAEKNQRLLRTTIILT